MSDRINTFAGLTDPPAFELKPRRDKPVTTEAFDRLADESGFHSRPAVRTVREPKRKQRRYRTGRNCQLSIKATIETVDRFGRMAEDRKLTSGALLEQALDALERAGV